MALAFNRDRCCHLALCLRLILLAVAQQYMNFDCRTYCPPEAAVCGLQTRIHPAQGDLAWEDDAGLTDIRLQCCKI